MQRSLSPMLRAATRGLALAATLTLTAACTSAVATGGHRASLAPDSPLRGQPRSDLIVPIGEIADARQDNLFDALMRTRPNQIRARLASRTETQGALLGGPAGIATEVYVDDHYLGDVSELKRMPTTGFSYVRFLTRLEAMIQYGRSAEGGAIVIRTR